MSKLTFYWTIVSNKDVTEFICLNMCGLNLILTILPTSNIGNSNELIYYSALDFSNLMIILMSNCFHGLIWNHLYSVVWYKMPNGQSCHSDWPLLYLSWHTPHTCTSAWCAVVLSNMLLHDLAVYVLPLLAGPLREAWFGARKLFQLSLSRVSLSH